MEQIREAVTKLSSKVTSQGPRPMKSSMAPADCEICGGLGWYRKDVDFGDPEFGQMFLCDCQFEERQKWLSRLSRLSGEMLDYRFEGWRSRGKLAEMPKTLERLLKTGFGWATLSGPPGTGKTFLLAATVNEARERGMTAVYTTTADLLADLRDTFNPDSGTGYSELFTNVQSAEVLCLDEIEKFRTTLWAEEQFFRLMEHRYRTWDQTITVLATNRKIGLDTTILADTQYPGYLESRIMDGRFAHLEFWDVTDARPVLRSAQ